VTKKHFIELADQLKLTKPTEQYRPAEFEQWESDCKAVANACHASNSAFNRTRWIDYVNGKCGPSGGAR